MKSKIIIRVDTDDVQKINELNDKVNQGDIMIIPQGDHIKVWVINEQGNVTDLNDVQAHESVGDEK